MKRHGYRHPAHSSEPVAESCAASPVATPAPAFTSLEDFAGWLDGELQSLEIRFRDFVTRQSTRVAAGLTNKKTRR